jgi:hypothetical protein
MVRYVLVSKDDKKFEFPVGLTEQSSFIKEQIEGLTDTTREVFEIPVNQFNGHVVEKCLEFMIHHDKVPITMPAKPLQRKLEDYFSNSFDLSEYNQLPSVSRQTCICDPFEDLLQFLRSLS